jgi:hypothetical protein
MVWLAGKGSMEKAAWEKSHADEQVLTAETPH